MNNYENELYHHGIKGQKWGVRRYQNPDGSLTPEGRKRYLKSDGSLTEEGKKYFSKKPTGAQKKAYKQAFKRADDKYHGSEQAKRIDTRLEDLERIPEEEFYKDPDAYYYTGGTKKAKQAENELEELYDTYITSRQAAIVDDLLETYSPQEIRWIDRNIVSLGMHISDDILQDRSGADISSVAGISGKRRRR